MPIFDPLLEEIFQEINDEVFKLPLFQVSIQCLNQKKSNIAKIYVSRNCQEVTYFFLLLFR